MKKTKWAIVVTGLTCLAIGAYIYTLPSAEKRVSTTAVSADSSVLSKKASPETESPEPERKDAGGLEENFPTAPLLILKDAVGIDLRDHPNATLEGVMYYAEPAGRKKKKDDIALIADPKKKSCHEKNPGILWTDHEFKCLKIIKSFKFEPKDFRGADISVSDMGDVRVFYFVKLDLTRDEFDAELAKGNDPAKEAYAKVRVNMGTSLQKYKETGTSQ